MAHTCPTCSEPCYCMGDYEEVLTGQPAYCRHCTEWSKQDEYFGDALEDNGEDAEINIEL